jgi:outer membrane protein
MRHPAAVLTIAVALASSAHADTLFGVYAGAGSWQQNFEGDLSALGSTIDVEDDLGIGDEFNNVLYLAIEHPLPVLPNVRATWTEVTTDGFDTIGSSISFAGASFAAGTDVATDMDLSQGDLTLYYELLDNWVSVDAGLSLRYFDGFMELSGGGDEGRAEFHGALPLVYGRARFELPFTGGWIGAEVQGIAYDGNDLVDANAQLGWVSPVGVGFEAGWRVYRIELDEFDEFDTTALMISGPYAALNLHF